MNSNRKNSESSLRITKNISKAKLKWFNAAKGFGFVVPEENPVDAFLHITQLQELGLHGLGEGAEILCVIDRRYKGAVVSELIEVLATGQLSEDSLERDAANPDNYKIKGIVKKYDRERGFGFIAPDDAKKDIFVHKSCLQSQDIEAIYPGQRVRVLFKIAEKGREAVSVQIEETP
jgi:CspA family cold shock protein